MRNNAVAKATMYEPSDKFDLPAQTQFTEPSRADINYKVAAGRLKGDAGRTIPHPSQLSYSGATARSQHTSSDEKLGSFVPLSTPETAISNGTPQLNFVALQEWEGYVVDIGQETFRARLIDVTNGETTAGEEVELFLQDLNTVDRSKVALGAIFRWTIGYQIAGNRPRLRGSQIVFRDIPRLNETEYNQLVQRGAERAAKIRFD